MDKGKKKGGNSENAGRKRQNRGRKKMWVFLLLFAAATAAGCSLYRQETTQAAQTDAQAEEIELKDNQRLAYYRVEAATGNDIDVILMQKTEDGNAEATEERSQLRILVGTPVITQLGSETTFSRLAAGDILKCLLEETKDGKEIIKVWIEE